MMVKNEKIKLKNKPLSIKDLSEINDILLTIQTLEDDIFNTQEKVVEISRREDPSLVKLKIFLDYPISKNKEKQNILDEEGNLKPQFANPDSYTPSSPNSGLTVFGTGPKGMVDLTPFYKQHPVIGQFFAKMGGVEIPEENEEDNKETIEFSEFFDLAEFYLIYDIILKRKIGRVNSLKEQLKSKFGIIFST